MLFAKNCPLMSIDFVMGTLVNVPKEEEIQEEN